jgi:CheY-like chemotaxis protein
MFEISDFEVITAENGQIALEIFKDSLSQRTFDLIFMDLNMPEMNGFEAC